MQLLSNIFWIGSLLQTRHVVSGNGQTPKFVPLSRWPARDALPRLRPVDELRGHHLVVPHTRGDERIIEQAKLISHLTVETYILDARDGSTQGRVHISSEKTRKISIL